MSYNLTRRTQIGLDLEEAWQINHYQGAYITTARASIGRKMGEHWFLNVNGGYAYTRQTKGGGLLPNSQVIGGGSLGFKTYQHTLTGAYNRTSTDAYGLIGTVSSIGGSWRWHHPGSDYALTTGYSQQQTRNTGFVSLSGWEATGGITRKMSDRTVVTGQYVYFQGNSTFDANLVNLTVQSVRLSLEWSPQLNLR
jgi:hypothetical protein